MLGLKRAGRMTSRKGMQVEMGEKPEWLELEWHGWRRREEVGFCLG